MRQTPQPHLIGCNGNIHSGFTFPCLLEEPLRLFSDIRELRHNSFFVCAVAILGWDRAGSSRRDCRHAYEMQDPQGPVAFAMRHEDQPSAREGSWCGSHDAGLWLGRIPQRILFLTPLTQPAIHDCSGPIHVGAGVNNLVDSGWLPLRIAASSRIPIEPQ